jgi:LmbE family N-acetylglucosaminyl deacetylase
VGIVVRFNRAAAAPIPVGSVRSGAVRRGPTAAALPFRPSSVLAVVAHPDDESFGLGGLLAAFGTAGARLGVLCFTRGEASTLGKGVDLAQVRARELAAAGAALGLAWCRLRDHPDGRLADEPTDALAAEVAEAARETSADLLLAFDETGVTGHPDHRAAAAAAVAAGRRLGIPVLGWTVTPELADRLNAELGTTFVATVPDFVVTVDRDRQRRAIAAHRSQAAGNRVLERRLALSGDTDAVRWLVAPASP